MTELVIELPKTLDQQLKDRGLTAQQMQMLVTRFVELYLSHELDPALDKKVEALLAQNETDLTKPRFGSGKHLGIIMADDFDEPLEDFAEYM
jgi:hypothetical protein